MGSDGQVESAGSDGRGDEGNDGAPDGAIPDGPVGSLDGGSVEMVIDLHQFLTVRSLYVFLCGTLFENRICPSQILLVGYLFNLLKQWRFDLLHLDILARHLRT